jgi:hypothetical protein
VGFNIFFNDRKQAGSKQPDYRGNGDLDDETIKYIVECYNNNEPVELDAAGWKQEGRRGTYINIRISKPYDGERSNGRGRDDSRGRGRDDDRRRDDDRPRGRGRDDDRQRSFDDDRGRGRDDDRRPPPRDDDRRRDDDRPPARSRPVREDDGDIPF